MVSVTGGGVWLPLCPAKCPAGRCSCSRSRRSFAVECCSFNDYVTPISSNACLRGDPVFNEGVRWSLVVGPPSSRSRCMVPMFVGKFEGVIGAEGA